MRLSAPSHGALGSLSIIQLLARTDGHFVGSGDWQQSLLRSRWGPVGFRGHKPEGNTKALPTLGAQIYSYT